MAYDEKTTWALARAQLINQVLALGRDETPLAQTQVSLEQVLMALRDGPTATLPLTGIRTTREITEAEDNARLVPMSLPLNQGPKRTVEMLRIDPVKREAEGTLVALVFRITGYREDSNGGLLASVEQVDQYGDETGWSADCLDLPPDSAVVLDRADRLHLLAVDPVPPRDSEKEPPHE